MEMDSNIIGRILFMNFSLMQIFYYCWFGNEVKLKVQHYDEECNKTLRLDFLRASDVYAWIWFSFK